MSHLERHWKIVRAFIHTLAALNLCDRTDTALMAWRRRNYLKPPKKDRYDK